MVLPAASGPSADDKRRPSDGLAGPHGLADVPREPAAELRPAAAAVRGELDHQPEVAGVDGVAHGVDGLQAGNWKGDLYLDEENELNVKNDLEFN